LLYLFFISYLIQYFFAFLIFNSSILKLITGNDIKLDLLKYLNDDDIKLLIPKLGTQILFREKLKEFLNTIEAKHTSQASNSQTTVSVIQNNEEDDAKNNIQNVNKYINDSVLIVDDTDSSANNGETLRKR